MSSNSCFIYCMTVKAIAVDFLKIVLVLPVLLCFEHSYIHFVQQFSRHMKMILSPCQSKSSDFPRLFANGVTAKTN